MATQHRGICASTLILALFLLGAGSASGQDATAEQQAAITGKAQAYVEAFKKGDANALAGFWTPDGDYTDIDGRVLKGRKAIAQDFTKFLAANKGAALRIDVQSIRFPTPDVAIEDGTTTILPPNGGVPDRARYTNVLVKRDGDWLLESVRESVYAPPSNYDHLQPLGWLIGDWVQDTKEGSAGRILFEWTPDRNYIVGARAVGVKGALLDNGLQRIGWDAAGQHIRSWNFDNDGGFSQGAWKADGDKWVITTNAVMASGATAIATTTLTRTDDNTMTLQSKVQSADSKEPTDLPVITMKRVQSQDDAEAAPARSSLPAQQRP